MPRRGEIELLDQLKSNSLDLCPKDPYSCADMESPKSSPEWRHLMSAARLRPERSFQRETLL